MNSKKTATCAVLLLMGTMAQSAVSPVLPVGVDAVQVGTVQDIGERQSLLIEMDRLAELAPAPADGATVAESGQLSEEFDGLVAENAPTKRRRVVKKTSAQSSASGASSPSAATKAARTGDPRVSAIKREEDRARQAVRRGDYPEATKLFFNLLDKETNPARVLQIRFILGRTLQEMGLHQVSAFPYYEIVRTEVKKNPKNKYVRQSLERLTVAADALDSDILLNYAVRLIDEEEFPAGNRDMLFYRRGEVRLREGNYIEAAKEFNRVRGNSVFHDRARYRLGLSLVEAGQLEKAEQVFVATAEAKSSTDVTKRARVNAMLGRARTLYQRKLFAEAIDAYREIPRDTEQWHDALFEVSWAYLQDGRFRSALSNFHSLHSPFYEEFYQPESLLLRAIVYHYICRYDEMEKTLGIFERIYGPVQKELRNVLGGNMSPIALYREIRKVDENFDVLKKTGKRQLAIPFLVARQVLREGDVRRSLSYIRALEREKKKIEQAPATWRDARVGRYAKRVVERRMEATQLAVGRLILRHLTRLQDELAGHMEQAGLVRIDMISGKKEAGKKEIAGKGTVRESVDQEQDRSYYVQNGYDYWPFTGEYWLDEIGNYHYVGVKACE
ncbi:MAG: tetratricopeptide repeat protein [Bdellovibrionales bacterium]|nr:tetratricopeptide repeat protein [Bdellovibrionales bacterium]